MPAVTKFSALKPLVKEEKGGSPMKNDLPTGTPLMR
jgi:hypothetical protein